MNFLFIGLGSIGQRHLRNLNTISKKNKIYAYRRKFNTPNLNNKNQVIKTDIIKKPNIMPTKQIICRSLIFFNPEYLSISISLLLNNLIKKN